MEVFRWTLGVLVVTFAPGFLILRHKKIKLPTFTFWLLSVFLSLSLIFQISFFSTVFSQPWLYWAYFFSVLLLFVLDLKSISVNDVQLYLGKFKDNILDHPVRTLMFVFILFFIVKSSYRFDGVFTKWDAVVSWNRWAIDWYNNVFPKQIYHYPQLIPTAWAALYRYLGHDYQYFVVFLVPLIVFLFLLSIAEMNRENKGASFIFFVIIFYWITHLFDEFLFDGYVDLVLLSFSGLCLILLQKIRINYKDENYVKNLSFFTLLIAANACLVKQGGFFILSFVMIELLIINFKNLNRTILVKSLFAVFSIIVPFYIYVEHEISLGKNASEIQYVTQAIYGDKTYFHRFTDAVSGMRFSRYLFLMNFALVFFFKGFHRRLVLFTSVVFFVWAVFFSYDYRNLSVGYVAAAFTFGSLFGEILETYTQKFFIYCRVKSVKDIKLSTVIILFMFFIMFVSSFVTNEQLALHSRKLRINSLINPIIENFLYQGRWRSDCAKIYSSWQMIGYLPDYESKYEYIGFNAELLSSNQIYVEKIKNDDKSCMILPTSWYKNISNVFSKDYKKVFETSDLIFIQKI